MPYHNQVVPDEWREPIGEWLGVQRAAGLSPETIKTKRCEIGHVAKGVNASPAKVTGRQLVAYSARKRGRTTRARDIGRRAGRSSRGISR